MKPRLPEPSTYRQVATVIKSPAPTYDIPDLSHFAVTDEDDVEEVETFTRVVQPDATTYRRVTPPMNAMVAQTSESTAYRSAQPTQFGLGAVCATSMAPRAASDQFQGGLVGASFVVTPISDREHRARVEGALSLADGLLPYFFGDEGVTPARAVDTARAWLRGEAVLSSVLIAADHVKRFAHEAEGRRQLLFFWAALAVANAVKTACNRQAVCGFTLNAARCAANARTQRALDVDRDMMMGRE